jgi:hypothetical protein
VARAQATATIVGTVADSSGAVVPGVKVSVTNTGTGVVRSLETNAAGNYIAPELIPGTYEVKAEFKGFNTFSRTGIVLNVNDNVRVDIAMQVGQVTQSVEVSVGAVKVQTESGEITDLISSTQLSQLPVNTRSFFVLATLTAGVSSAMPDFTLPIPVGGDSSIRFNGNRNDHNIWMIDGGEDYDRGCGGCVTVMPSMDALQEFKVMSSNYGADFGIGSGGTVNMMLKSGTRGFHGTAYEYARNDALDAVNYFTNAVPRNADGTRSAAAPIMRFNNFGWNLAGPFYIPGKYNTAKNKTFFFFNQEWRKIRLGSTVSPNSPGQALRNGDFSGYGTTIMVPTAAQVGDPAMLAKFAAAGVTPGQPFPGNRIPSSLIDPNATLFWNTGAIPLPNYGSQSTGSRMVPTNVREEIIRVDHNFSDKLSVMAHFINDAVLQQTMTTLWAGMSYPTLGTSFLNPGKSAVLRVTYTINPTLLNEFAYNYNGNRIWLTPVGIYAQPSGWTVNQFFPGDADSRLPVISWAKQMGTNYDTGSWPWHNAADSQQVRDDVSKMTGKHALKFGGQFMRYRKNQDIFGQTQGGYNFNGRFTGSDVADFDLGLANSYHELAVQDRGHWRTSTISLYLTDSWRATKRLTLNLGLRWEIMPHVYEVKDRQSNFFPTLYNAADAPIFNADGSLDTSGPGFTTVSGIPLSSIPFYMNGVGMAGKNGIPRGLVDNHFKTIGPRVGFAYDLTGNGKTVVRGGFGMFYERIQGNDVYNGGPNPPFSFDPSVSLVYFSNPSVSVLNGAAAAVPIFPGSFAQALAKEYLPPTSQQWSFGLQRELTPRTVLSVEYVGNGNYHQSINRAINSPLPSDPRRADVRAGTIGVDRVRPYLGFSSISYAENSTSGNYHSLQVNLRAENHHGLTFQGAYTWSHTIDFASGDNATYAYNPYDLSSSRGAAGWDIRHIVMLNYIYDLPFLKNSSNAVVRHVVAGWQLSGITRFQTGPPTTVTYPGDNVGEGVGNVRPDLIGSTKGPKTVNQWFNTAAFAAPAPMTWGTEGRDIVYQPGRNNWNMSLLKRFSGIPVGTKEGAQLEFRAEFFNAFNHTQFSGVDTNYASGTFGKVTGTNDARRIQLGLRLVF